MSRFIYYNVDFFAVNLSSPMVKVDSNSEQTVTQTEQSEKKALVTGANGFLGAHLTRELLTRGFKVNALVRSSSNLDLLKELCGENFETSIGDVTYPQSLEAALKDCHYVFHLAAVMTAKRSQHPLLKSVNIEGTRNIVELCIKTKIEKLIHVSSIVALGSRSSPSGEAAHDNRIHNFSAKKLSQKIVLDAAHSGKLNAIVAQPGMMYGAGDALKEVRSGGIKAARGALPFYTEGGVNVVAVEDVAKTLVDSIERGRSGEAYVLGGENLTFKELLNQIAECAGHKGPQKKLSTSALRAIGRIGDLIPLADQVSLENMLTATLYHWAESDKARNELGFSPRPAKEAIANSVQWMKKNGYLSQ